MPRDPENYRRWYEANREKIIARTGANHKAHPEKGRQYTRDYRVRRRLINSPTPERTPCERFDALIMPVTESGCWIWMGLLTAKGYATMKIHQKATPMHRWAYEHFVKPIPEGLTIDHLCRVKCCVNPAHLEPVTGLVNTQRGKKWYWDNAQFTRPTHCPNGHEYTADNTAASGKDGRYRMCRICRTEQSRKAYLRYRASH